MANPPAPLQRGIVKQVLSGDTIVIRGQPKGGPPPEKTIILAYITAPKVSKRIPPSADHPKGQISVEEPFGWETREFLRKKLIGKEVQFRPEYSVPFSGGKRECGLLYFGDENIVSTLVSEGFVDVTKRKQNAENPDVIQLTLLEEDAKAAGKGKHAAQIEPKREVLFDFERPEDLIGKTYDAIVEHVINGSTIRVALESGPRSYKMVTVMISGIRAPGNNDPFGDEARYFTESRLLQKEVKVRLESVMPGQTPSYHGSVTLGANNIAEHLVKEGMAKCADRTILQTMAPEKLRAAEVEAKQKKLRIWKDYKAVVRNDADSYEAKVLEVINGDALRVENLTSKKEEKIFLASVRPPPRPENEKVTRVLYDVPFMFEAREFLRKRLIGKKVKVHVDYIQPAREVGEGRDKLPEKICATVLTTDGGINVAEALIARGLATVVRYRQDDDQRSSAYDTLQAAEQKAKLGGKGIHAGPGTPQRIVDLSNDPAKAKSFHSFLSKSRNEAIVEYVLSASKLRIYVPKQNCCLSLILVGISTPRGTEPYVNESKAFVNSLVLQREVQVTIEALDKAGNFIGGVFFDGKNLTSELLKAGYASIRDERGNDYKAAEDEAKAAKLRIWENYKEEEKPVEEENGDDQEEPTPAEGTKTNGDTPKKPVKDDRTKVVITQVSQDGVTISAQNVENGSSLEELLGELREELAANPPLPGAYQPAKGDVVAAKFSEDNEWYRARIDKLASGAAQVTFVDYGNKETVKNRDLAPLPSSKFNLASYPAAAKEYKLAYVSLPEDPELIDESREELNHEANGRVLLLKSEYKDTTTGADHVTLFDPETNNDVVLGLLTEGFYMMNLKDRRKGRRFQKTVDEYKSAQDAAKKKRLNLWRYGDFTEDDAKEFGFKAT